MVSCLILIFAWLMTTTQNIKLAWLRITSTTEGAKNYKIRVSQSMPWRPNAVLGLIKELSSTREYSVSRKAKARFVVKKSPQEVNNLDLRL